LLLNDPVIFTAVFIQYLIISHKRYIAKAIHFTYAIVTALFIDIKRNEGHKLPFFTDVDAAPYFYRLVKVFAKLAGIIGNYTPVASETIAGANKMPGELGIGSYKVIARTAATDIAGK
jgi:hypothetical protein